jgi:ankyrin repeat protein
MLTLMVWMKTIHRHCTLLNGMVKLLLHREDITKVGPLSLAACYNHFEAAKLLLE